MVSRPKHRNSVRIALVTSLSAMLCAAVYFYITHSPAGDGLLTLSRDSVVRWQVSGTLGEPPELFFAADGSQRILAWWLTTDGGIYSKKPGKQVVFDFEGRPIREGTDEKGLLNEPFFTAFPSVSWRQKWDWFVKDADGWGFATNWSRGVRLYKDTKVDNTSRVEEWILNPSPKKQFESSINGPGAYGVPDDVKYLAYNCEPCIVLCLYDVYILTEKNGELKDRFNFGTLIYGPGIERLSFAPGHAAIDPDRRLIACGANDSKLVAVVELDPPHRVVAKLNSADPSPGTGAWNTTHLSFNASYLIAKFQYGGRGIWNPHNSIEVYRTTDWQLCYTAPSGVSDLAISPDGSRMAYVRGSEIQMFQVVERSRVQTPASDPAGR